MTKSNPEIRFLRILEIIKHRFAFLFRRGFHVVSVLFFDQDYEDWQVTLATDNCTIKVYRYIGKVGLTLSIPEFHYAVGVLELNDLINGDKGFSDEDPPMKEAQSLEELARLLEKYLDEILEKIGKMIILVPMNDYSIPSGQPGQIFQYN